MDGVNPTCGGSNPCVAGGGVCDAQDEAVDQIQVEHGVVLTEGERGVGHGGEVCEVACGLSVDEAGDAAGGAEEKRACAHCEGSLSFFFLSC